MNRDPRVTRIDAGRPGARRDQAVTIVIVIAVLLGFIGVCALCAWFLPTWPLT